MSTAHPVVDHDRALRVSIALGLSALVATVLLLLSAMPRPVLVVVLSVAIASSVSSLVLAVGSAKRSREQSLHYRELLAQAAHQLRTPTATLSMEIDAALADPKLGASGLALAQRLAGQVQAQRHLVERLLAYARLEMRTDPIRDCDARELLDDANRVLAPVAAAHGVLLRTRVEIDTVRGSQAELRELLVILGENAIVHGGGRVVLAIEQDARGPVISVFDGGEGIAAPVDGRGDSGIGLELARIIVARHRGTLELSLAEPPRDATQPTIRVRLPRRKVGARLPR